MTYFLLSFNPEKLLLTHIDKIRIGSFKNLGISIISEIEECEDGPKVYRSNAINVKMVCI